MDMNDSTKVEKTMEANASQSSDSVVPANAGEHKEPNAERLLEESKKYKARFQETKKELEELRRQLDSQKQSELAEQGKYKDLWAKEKESKEAWVTKYVETKIRDSVKSAAAKAGCIDPDIAYQLGDIKLVEFDQETHNVDGAEVVIEELKKQKPYLFSNSKPKTIINATIPSFHEEAPRTLKDLSLDEKLDLFKRDRVKANSRL